jgi:hypothetical protein
LIVGPRAARGLGARKAESLLEMQTITGDEYMAPILSRTMHFERVARSGLGVVVSAEYYLTHVGPGG